MEFRSPKYPSLIVAHAGVRFRDGRAVARTPYAVEELGKLAHLGVEPVNPPEPAPKPRRATRTRAVQVPTVEPAEPPRMAVDMQPDGTPA